MTYEEAMQALKEGKKVKLPEWQGYWYQDERGWIMVLDRYGNVWDTPHLDDYKNRVDWELTNGKRDFGGALTALKAGKKIAREGWNGKGMYLIHIPDGGYYVTKLTYPSHEKIGELNNSQFIAMKTADSKFVPWLASQTDVLAEDWIIVE